MHWGNTIRADLGTFQILRWYSQGNLVSAKNFIAASKLGNHKSNSSLFIHSSETSKTSLHNILRNKHDNSPKRHPIYQKTLKIVVSNLSSALEQTAMINLSRYGSTVGQSRPIIYKNMIAAVFLRRYFPILKCYMPSLEWDLT